MSHLLPCITITVKYTKCTTMIYLLLNKIISTTCNAILVTEKLSCSENIVYCFPADLENDLRNIAVKNTCFEEHF